jgi:hypothetical protein
MAPTAILTEADLRQCVSADSSPHSRVGSVAGHRMLRPRPTALSYALRQHTPAQTRFGGDRCVASGVQNPQSNSILESAAWFGCGERMMRPNFENLASEGASELGCAGRAIESFSSAHACVHLNVDEYNQIIPRHRSRNGSASSVPPSFVGSQILRRVGLIHKLVQVRLRCVAYLPCPGSYRVSHAVHSICDLFVVLVGRLDPTQLD